MLTIANNIFKLHSNHKELKILFSGHPEIERIEKPNRVIWMADDCISTVTVAVLEDHDITSCYDIIKTSETLVLNTASAIGNMASDDDANTVVNITTRQMDCSDPFYVSVYQMEDELKCGPTERQSVSCILRYSSAMYGEYSHCTFVCDCIRNNCSNNNVIYIQASNPIRGELCDITVGTVPALTNPPATNGNLQGNGDPDNLGGSEEGDAGTLNESEEGDAGTLNESEKGDAGTLNESEKGNAGTVNGSEKGDHGTLDGSEKGDTGTLDGSIQNAWVTIF